MSGELGGGFWLLAQVGLLVAYYGGFAPTLPMWVVWFPSLIVVIPLTVAGIVLVGIWIYSEIVWR